MALHANPDPARTVPAETKIVIYVAHPFSLWHPPRSMAEALLRRWPEMCVAQVENTDRLCVELPGMHIFVGYGLEPQQFTLARNLKWIHSTAAGVSQLMHSELRNSGVLVTNPKGVFSAPMAEHTMGLLIALTRNFPEAFRYQEHREWAQQELWDKSQGFEELNGRLVLILGFGSVGREVARLARAFCMRVWGLTRSGQGDSALAERILSSTRLDEALPEADYLVIAAPETPETHKLIGASELARMKRGARLVNISRGSLLDETALVRALESGALAGAALDVASEEPLPCESPLWSAPNLILTPHISAASRRLWERHTALFMEQMERWFDGRPLLNRVDFSRGY
jgi:phosphoglycerate dehydrogenase-like enzyme